ncbi:MAG: DUF86 domain-containing protein [Cyanobacteria bacterium J06614_10]
MAQTEFDIVLRKLSNIKKYIDQLQRKADLSEAEYTQDFEQQLVVERLLHMLVGSAVDINSHIVASSRQATPDPSRGSFLVLAERGILSSDLAQQLAPVVGLRNRLVYGRDDIDNSIVYQSIAGMLLLFPQYLQQIQEYLERG